MLAGHAVEPALDAAGQQEVVLVDGQHAAFQDDALEEPVGQRDRHALAACPPRPRSQLSSQWKEAVFLRLPRSRMLVRTAVGARRRKAPAAGECSPPTCRRIDLRRL